MFWYDRKLRKDREKISELHTVAKWRNYFYQANGILFASDVDPADATYTLRSTLPVIPADLRGDALVDFLSYPAYLFTKFAEKFPKVQRGDLDWTVAKLFDCHARCASRASLTCV